VSAGGAGRAAHDGTGADAAVGTDATAASGPRRRWPVVVLAVAFALLFAWDVVEAVGNLVSVPLDSRYANNDFYRENGLDGLVAEPPWVVLVLGVLLPPVAFVLALVASRRRSLGVVALALAAGLATVAALNLTITAYVTSL